MLGTKRLLGREGRLPIPLQGAGHKPVLRIDRFVAAPRQRGLVAGPLQALPPLPVLLGALVGCGSESWEQRCTTTNGVIECAPEQRPQVEGVPGELLDGGTYDVTLTVTDDDGATNSTTGQVTVSAPTSEIAFRAGAGSDVNSNVASVTLPS